MSGAFWTVVARRRLRHAPLVGRAGPVFLIEFGAIILGLGLLGRVVGRFQFSPIQRYLLAGLAFGEGCLQHQQRTGGIIGGDGSAVARLLTVPTQWEHARSVLAHVADHPRYPDRKHGCWY